MCYSSRSLEVFNDSVDYFLLVVEPTNAPINISATEATAPMHKKSRFVVDGDSIGVFAAGLVEAEVEVFSQNGAFDFDIQFSNGFGLGSLMACSFALFD